MGGTSVSCTRTGRRSLRALHRAMMTMMLAAVLAVGAGVLQQWNLTALAQHGEAEDPQAHFDMIAERLSLSEAQRETLAEPFHAAFAAMQELQQQMLSQPRIKMTIFPLKRSSIFVPKVPTIRF